MKYKTTTSDVDMEIKHLHKTTVVHNVQQFSSDFCQAITQQALKSK